MKKLENLENDMRNSAQRIFDALQTVEPVLPTPFYWMSPDGVVLGINNLMLEAMGTTREIIGKKPYAFYKREIAEHILKHNAKVMRQEEILSQEEWIEDITTKKHTCFSSIKAPLYDDEGTIIGIVGTSIDITAEKEAEERELAAQNEKVRHLRLENELHQTIIQEQKRFRETVLKVAHDINSPLAALNMMLEVCNELPEDKRSFLRRATESILDIANNLLTDNDSNEENLLNAEIEFRQPLLASDLLVQLLSEKRVQYHKYPITFETNITSDAQFAFIQVQKTAFRRSMSNLINNAVDALKGNGTGTVTIHLSANVDSVFVTVQDNGKGMSQDKVEKILERQSFTHGKENGHGLGLQQVWDTLECNQGTILVKSSIGQGTSIQLTFPRIAASSWIAQEIILVPDNIIVVLDDEASIHHAWDLRFTPFLATHPSLRLHHFTQGQNALDFLSKLNLEEKNRVVLLSDYEFLHQSRNGLQIIEASQIKGAMLVTSYYANLKIVEAATQLNVKILPKQMAAIIPIDMAVK